MDYKKKALKYKYKYETLLKELKLKGHQTGGFDREIFLVFENELKIIYSLVSGFFDPDENEHIALTGSGALAYIVNRLGMEEELRQMNVPNDIDIVYYIGRKTDPSQVEAIGDYVVQDGQRTLNSRKYNLKQELSEGKEILSFDLTNMKSSSHPDFIEFEDSIGGRSITINILNLNKLKMLYEDSEIDDSASRAKVQSRIELIDRIIKHIRSSQDPELLHKYKLDLGVTTRRGPSSSFSSRGRPVSSFSSLLEDNEQSDNEESDGQFKLKSVVFESDEEEDLPMSKSGLGLFGKTNSLSESPFKRPNLEGESPEFSSRRGLKLDYRTQERESGAHGLSETLAGITELEGVSTGSPQLFFKPTNRHLFVGVDDEETLDGITELGPKKTQKSQEPTTNQASDSTLAGISEIESRRFKQRDIRLPPIRPTK